MTTVSSPERADNPIATVTPTPLPTRRRKGEPAPRAKGKERLTKAAIAKLSRRGFHHDGHGLYLAIAKGGSKSWLFRYQIDGKARAIGLGGYPRVSIDTARELAAVVRQDLARARLGVGPDPLEARRRRKNEERAATQAARNAPKAKTFRECAIAYIATQAPAWRSAKHAKQWTATLEDYAIPFIGDRPVDAIDQTAVIDILNQIDPRKPEAGTLWSSKPETASRVRGRIESVLGWAAVAGFRSGDNPAAWRGRLQHVFPAKTKLKAVRHHAAMPYRDVPAFMATLRSRDTTSSRALQFCILTASRTQEVTLARWSEIDRKAKIWTIPGTRMKSKREHVVPLSDSAIAILNSCLHEDGNDHVFLGGRKGTGLSSMGMHETLKAIAPDVTVHGFRSAFRDWAGDETDHPREVAEAALAHVVGDATERAYRRGDALEQRRRLMEAWANFCEIRQGEVIALRRPS